jgi:hypothetical protein
MKVNRVPELRTAGVGACEDSVVSAVKKLRTSGGGRADIYRSAKSQKRKRSPAVVARLLRERNPLFNPPLNCEKNVPM